MDILSQVIDAIIKAVPPEVLRGVAIALPTVPGIWTLIEWVLPATTSARTNHLTNILGNMTIYFGLQASGTVSFGVGWHGYVGAAVFSLIGFGATLILNKVVKGKLPALTNPSGGA